MSYGQTLKKIRLARGLSLRDLEKITGIGSSGLSKIENEHSTKGKEKLKIPIDTLQSICKSLDYPFRTFLEEAGYIEPIQLEYSSLEKIESKMNEKQKEVWTKLGEHILNEDIQGFLTELKNLENKD